MGLEGHGEGSVARGIPGEVLQLLQRLWPGLIDAIDDCHLLRTTEDTLSIVRERYPNI